ncbi:DUF6527 family protein [Roseovarius atlanticus]|uniref:DUF6527 family protein n=1 Tax=Roseovarius atlanticus TaxID=1641875 RepID=UPI001C979A2B|nr:DUF6527 family protein [Roseovarius atlanticus]MBY5988224.1 ammonia monooxygenase [Roseovarius atlanticus]MBY6123615.1 ammonia monooxygenase [Roseovarius atlanticus]MBY6148110.1 ammonia monooxygenase [Roseovarius atlanticus]
MSALGSKLRKLEGGRVAFMCPGCQQAHHVTVDGSRGWTFNGDGDRPTFSPSVLVSGTVPITDEEHARLMAGEKIEPVSLICHSFVTDGRIRFLNDCTHDLAGKTLDLPDWPGSAA